MKTLYNLSERDRAFVAPIYAKHLYKEYFINMIAKLSFAYEIYFVTFTFKNMKTDFERSQYEELFDYQLTKFHTATTNNNPKFDYKKPVLILFPESEPARHYHGILAVHKDATIQFHKKCVKSIEIEYSKKLEREVQSYRLNDKFINPYPKRYKQDEISRKLSASLSVRERQHHHRHYIQSARPLLEVADYRL